VSIGGSVLDWIYLAELRPNPPIALEYTEETGFESFVTSGAVAVLINSQQDGISITIDPNLAHRLKIARLLSFAPQLPPRSGEIACAADPDGFRERLTIHVGDHQYPTAAIVLGYYREYTAPFVKIEFQGIRCHDCRSPLVSRTAMPNVD
jgi:hypothetical protein